MSGTTAASIRQFLGSKAKAKLEKLNSKHVYYEFQCYYQHIQIGEVIELVYGDISVKSHVTTLEFSLKSGVPMRVKIRGV